MCAVVPISRVNAILFKLLNGNFHLCAVRQSESWGTFRRWSHGGKKAKPPLFVQNGGTTNFEFCWVSVFSLNSQILGRQIIHHTILHYGHASLHRNFFWRYLLLYFLMARFWKVGILWIKSTSLKRRGYFEFVCCLSPRYLLGRAATCDLVCEHPSISRFHLMIQHGKKSW